MHKAIEAAWQACLVPDAGLARTVDLHAVASGPAPTASPPGQSRGSRLGAIRAALYPNLLRARLSDRSTGLRPASFECVAPSKAG
jgi:hypothetical protein